MTEEVYDPHNLLPGIQEGRYKVLRQSNVGTADVCHQRLVYELDPSIPGGKGEARAVGTGYHAGMARYYRVRQQYGGVAKPQDLRPYMAEAEGELEEAWPEGLVPKAKDDAVKKLRTMIEMYFGAELYWPAEYRVVEVERTFFMPLWDDWVAQGTIDLVLEYTPNGQHVIVDHKTAGRKWKKGKEHPRINNQAPWYSWWWAQLAEPASFYFDVLTYDGTFERRHSPVELLHQQLVLEKARRVTKMIDSGVEPVPNPTSNLCSALYCDHFWRCPWGAEADGVPATPVGSMAS